MDEIHFNGIVYLIANATYVLSYAVSNIFWLRWLAIAAGFATLPYLYFQIEPLWLAIFCQFMFISINAFHLIRLQLNRQHHLAEPV